MPKRVVPGSITNPYRNRENDFSPDLVGNQVTNGNAFFTTGNFTLTTNSSVATGEFFNTGEFSDVLTLENLNLTLQESITISNESNTLSVKLKTNPNNLTSYVYFSDARKFIESEIFDIINKWKGSLYSRFSYINDTVTDFNYNSDKNISYFTVSINVLQNNFNLVTENIEGLTTSFEPDDISYIQGSFKEYQISNDYGNFNIIGYTGNTDTDDYIKIKTKGLAWPTLLNTGFTSGSFEYHIRPTEKAMDDLFFDKLSPFQTQIMNKNSLPKKYTISLSRDSETFLGQTSTNLESFTWPVSDGFNIDYVGRLYGEYVERLLRFSAYFDREITNIMVRKLVAKAIFEFDTPGDGSDPNSGRKMDKLMKIWGREYDKIKTYIDGISFANVLTYDGSENMPDELIKMMAANLGFDTIQSFSDNSLIKFLQKTNQGVFNPQGNAPSLSDMDLELWRRLVINAWWLFKSKGTRKVIEFFLSLFNIDPCLVSFNEIVYVAEDKLDYPSIIRILLDYYGFIPNDQDIAVDPQGYPKILPNTNDYYFQLNGFWYDGGVGENTKPDTKGNNPHFGPYDFGKAYFEKYTCLLNNFEPVTTTFNLNQLVFNYFTDYTLGSIEGTGQVIVEGNNLGATTETGVGSILTNYNQFYGDVMNDDDRVENAVILNAGSDDETSNTGLNSFHINFFAGNQEQCLVDNCPTNISFETSGQITYVFGPDVLTLEDPNCCEYFGYENYLDINNGTSPCYWCPPNDAIIDDPLVNGDTQLLILKPDGTTKPLTPECCSKRGGTWFTPVTSSGNAGKPYCKKNAITVIDNPIGDVVNNNAGG